MDWQEPPAIYQMLEKTQFRSFGPTHLTIQKLAGEFLVRINLKDGTLDFGPSYSPNLAAQEFWRAMSEEYRRMLRYREVEQKVPFVSALLVGLMLTFVIGPIVAFGVFISRI